MPIISTMGALSYKTQTTAPIVNTGLILNYDIQNTASYSGSGATVVDLVGNSNATLTAGPTYSSAGPRYILFNGSTQYLITNTSLNPRISGTIISHFIWVYPQDNGVIVSELGLPTVDSGWHDAQIEMVAGTMCFNVWSSTSYNSSKISSSIATPLNTWHYVGLTYDGSTLRAYVNGVAAGSNTFVRLPPPGPPPAGSGLIYNIAGRDTTNMGDGTASNMRFGAFQVYNTALTGAQVLANYNATRATYGR